MRVWYSFINENLANLIFFCAGVLMKRSLMQVYVVGSDKAVPFYQSAFDAPLVACYPHDDGTFMHAELDIQGQILAVSERDYATAVKGYAVTGNTMQFCLQFGVGNEEMVKKAYAVLAKNAKIIAPLGPCSYSPLMGCLIDKYGINWCLFV